MGKGSSSQTASMEVEAVARVEDGDEVPDMEQSTVQELDLLGTLGKMPEVNVTQAVGAKGKEKAMVEEEEKKPPATDTIAGGGQKKHAFKCNYCQVLLHLTGAGRPPERAQARALPGQPRRNCGGGSRAVCHRRPIMPPHHLCNALIFEKNGIL
jgi:hypothetical protein